MTLIIGCNNDINNWMKQHENYEARIFNTKLSILAVKMT